MDKKLFFTILLAGFIGLIIGLFFPLWFAAPASFIAGMSLRFLDPFEIDKK